MSEQYFTQKPTSGSRESRFQLELSGESFTFLCDRGVFSVGELDAGTRILLDALPPLSGRILDLGCGWGAIGTILGRRYPEAEVLLSDVNERALHLAIENLKLNGVKNAHAVLSDGFENIEGTFDFIITNPPIRAGKQLIYSLFDTALARLKPGGRLYIVIRKQQGAESALRHLAASSAEVIEKSKGYWIIQAGGQANE